MGQFLNQEPFCAKNWLKGLSEANNQSLYSGIVSEQLSTQQVLDPLDECFPSFFSPSEIALDSEQIKSEELFNFYLDCLIQDVQTALENSTFNKRMKEAIYSEFMSYSEFTNQIYAGIEDVDSFWCELRKNNELEKNQLNNFIQVYALRVATIYFLKIRFLSHLEVQTNTKIDIKNLLNPNSFIIQTFKKTSSNELNIKSFEFNSYNLYRPQARFSEVVSRLSEVALELSVNQMIQGLSNRAQQLLPQSQHSPSLSQKNFGLFLNSLMINYCNWNHSIKNGSIPNALKSHSTIPKVISCKFTGHFINSLSLSHWLAQSGNLEIKWKELICPEFCGSKFETGAYLELFNELQFLTFLIEVAQKQKHPVISFITGIMKTHQNNKQEQSNHQANLFFDEMNESKSNYDRIILNLTKHPKNNPYFYILNKVNAEASALKENGKLFLICNKNIFIPSQKEKINTLLNTLELEAYFSLEEIENKGEVGNFIFIFNKTQKNEIKNAFLSFNLAGKIENFEQFSVLTKGLHSFIRDHLYEAPPYYQKELLHPFAIEFHHDALVDGRFLNSANKDSQHITHPKYFSNLVKSCVRFDNLFDVYPLKDEKNSFSNQDNLFLIEDNTHEFPLAVVIDYRLNNHTKIEIVPFQSLKAKALDYGFTRCQYFGIISKVKNFNINIFREYLSSSLGQQIINFTFTGNITKMKSKLNALLFPKFFIDDKILPDYIAKGFQLLTFDENKISQYKAPELLQNFNTITPLLNSTFTQYPKSIMGMLSAFKGTLKTLCIEKKNNEEFLNSLFSSKKLQESLVKTRLTPIYPHNEDVYIEFNVYDPEEVHLPLTKVEKIEKISNNEILHGLELYSQDKSIIVIYADKNTIFFIKYLASYLLGQKISSLLQSVQIPKSDEINQIIQSFTIGHQAIDSLSKKLNQLISTLFVNSLNQST